jgi:hypothetical protein
MNKSTLITGLLLTVLGILSGCYTIKPDAASGVPDYNTRVEIRNAHYDKVLTPIGAGSIVAGTATGMILGYSSNMIVNYNGDEPEKFGLGGMIIGGFIGYYTSVAINRLLGWGEVTYPKSAQEWIQKANPNYIILDEKSNRNFTVIHKSIEPHYIVKNFKDAKDFSIAFPKSKFTDTVCRQTLTADIKRNEYLELMDIFPHNKYLLGMKKKYVMLSPDVPSLFSAYDRFPETHINIELVGVDKTKDYYDAKTFHSRFPNSIFTRKVLIKSLDNSQVYQIVNLKNIFGSDFYLTQNDFYKYSAFVSDAGRKNYFHALFDINNPSNVFALQKFYIKYNWLNYPDKPTETLENFWNTADKQFSNGNDILTIFNNLKRSSASFGLDKYQIDNFVEDKLNEVIKQKLTYTVYLKTPTSIGWEQWINNNNLTAGMVNLSGLTYLVYGKIKNNSKFDLPLKVTAGGNLYMTYQIQGTGGKILNAVEIAASYFGQNINLTKHTEKYGQLKGDFYIPLLRKGQSSTYAITFDIGTKAGINVMDFTKFTEESELKDVDVFKITYYNGTIDDYQKKIQNTALNLLHYGMPDVKLIDSWRNTVYDNDYWTEKWELQQKELRYKQKIAAKEAQKLQNAKLTWKWVGDWEPEFVLWGKSPYNRKFIIYNNGKTWAYGNIRESSEKNHFSVEIHVDYSSKLLKKFSSFDFYWDEEDNDLELDGWLFFGNDLVKHNVNSYYDALESAINFTVQNILKQNL